MLFTLPADLTLYTLSFLPFQDIGALYTLSRSCRQFLEDHEDALYHQLAVSHRFAVLGVSLAHTVSAQLEKGGYHVKSVNTWKDLCRESVILERNWSGRGFVVKGGYTCFEDDVQQFAVDEQRGLLLTLTDKKTFVVCTLDGAHLVWSLPKVARFMQSGEFVLLWRGQDASGTIEAWRFVKNQDNISPGNGSSQSIPILLPSELAATKSQLAEHESIVLSTGTHGAYVPHATLPTPFGGWRISAFHTPYVALVNRDHPLLVQIYDIVRGELHQVVDLAPILASQPSNHVMHQPTLIFPFLLDLQLSSKYLCACLESAVALVRLRGSDIDAPLVDDLNEGGAGDVRKNAVVFRDTNHPYDKSGIPQCRKVDVLERDDSHLDNVSVPKLANLALAAVPGVDALEEYRVDPQVAIKERGALVATRSSGFTCFISAKFSPNGQHLVVGSTTSAIYFFPDINSVFDAGIAADEIVQKLAVEEPVRFVQWEGQDRVFAFKDDENNVWLVDLCPSYHTIGGHVSQAEPPLSIYGSRALRVRAFGRAYGRSYGSVQLRKAGVWAIADLATVCEGAADGVTAEEDADGGAVVGDGLWPSRKTVCLVSFTKEGIAQ